MIKVFFLMNFFNFCLKMNSFMSILVLFEFFVLILVLFIFWKKMSMFFLIFFLFITVLEAVLGLSLLIFFVRKYSSEKIFSFFF